MSTTAVRRTSFGVPAVRTRPRSPLMVLAWAAFVLAGLTMGWRALRWADRNL